MSPLDLHVLGTPPAFVLSQDQTLSFNPFIRIPSSRLGRSLSELTVVLSCVFSLYRFQGSAPLARSLYILSNLPRFVNTFFKVFGDFFAFFCASNDIFVYKFIVRLYVLYLVVCKDIHQVYFVSILLHSLPGGQGSGHLLPARCFAGVFASAEATRGLSARPLDPFGGLSFLAVIFLFHLRKHQWPPLFTERPQALSPSLWTPRAAFPRVSSTLPPGASVPAPGRTAPG